MNYLKAEVMEMCHSEGLYQIDLLNGSKERVTDREYWARKKGQAALDERNAPMIAGGITPRTTKFETDKAKLRRTIRAALSQATSFDEFSSLLLREGVTVKESRGRLSYLTPDRSKPITARKLGDDFDRTAVLSTLGKNAARAAEKASAIPEYPASIKERLQRNLLSYIGTKPSRDGLKAQKSEKARRAYREQHQSDFILAESASRYFREHGIKKLPSRKALQEEIQTLTVQKNAGYNDYREKRQKAQELQTVKRNIDQILRRDEPQRRKEQSHER